jgi:hypothetical protein
MAARFQFSCFSCHTTLSFSEVPGFRDDCDQCGADVHVCKNCRFYDAKAYNECVEPSAERVREKERSNFCEFFEPNEKTFAAKINTADDLRAKAEALFKKKS